MIKLVFDISDVVHANGHTQNANCGLYVKFRKFWLIPFCFIMRKDHLKKKLLLWPEVAFKEIIYRKNVQIYYLSFNKFFHSK